jgi:Fe2+ transport system protein B
MDTFDLADAALAAATAAKHAQIASNIARMAEEDAAHAVDYADDPKMVEEYAESARALALKAIEEAEFTARIARRAERILYAFYQEMVKEEEEN